MLTDGKVNTENYQNHWLQRSDHLQDFNTEETCLFYCWKRLLIFYLRKISTYPSMQCCISIWKADLISPIVSILPPTNESQPNSNFKWDKAKSYYDKRLFDPHLKFREKTKNTHLPSHIRHNHITTTSCFFVYLWRATDTLPPNGLECEQHWSCAHLTISFSVCNQQHKEENRWEKMKCRHYKSICLPLDMSAQSSRNYAEDLHSWRMS